MDGARHLLFARKDVVKQAILIPLGRRRLAVLLRRIGEVYAAVFALRESGIFPEHLPKDIPERFPSLWQAAEVSDADSAAGVKGIMLEVDDRHDRSPGTLRSVVFGQSLIPCSYMADLIQFRFPRTKKQRVRRKWAKRLTNYRRIPWPKALEISGSLYMHPALLAQLRSHIEVSQRTA